MEDLRQIDENHEDPESRDMEAFFRSILDMEQYHNPFKDLLQRDSQLLASMITQGAKENITIAVNAGRKEAYLFLYEASAQLCNIPVDRLINMDDEMQTRFLSFGLPSVMQIVQKRMHPFTVNVFSIDTSEFRSEVQVGRYVAIMAQWRNARNMNANPTR